MKHALDLFSFEGRVTRRQFLLAGIALFAVKYVLDTLVSWACGQPWNPLMYVSPRVSPLLHYRDNPGYWFALLAVAIPFIAAGVSLCARRLRDMDVNPFWCGLFFLPFLHWVFFLVLTVAPSSEPVAAAPAPEPDPDDAPLVPALARLLPDSTPGRFLLSQAASLALALVGIACLKLAPSNAQPFGGPLPSKEVLGVGLFFGLPFGMGFWSAFIVAYRRPPDVGLAAFVAGFCSLAVGLVALVATAVEGVACIIMATPILAPITLLGSLVGYLCARAQQPKAAIASLLLVLGLIADDVARPPEAVRLARTTELRIEASPEVVFRHCGRVSPIDEAPEPIFAICAMPLESTLAGEGVGARRVCVLTVGDIDEVVTEWVPGKTLEFAVKGAPERFTRYGALERGRFDLVANPDGTTTVRGTTWYTMRVAPAWYWSLWTQSFVGAVHRRVLGHVKRLAEDPTAPTPTAPARLPAWMAASNATCACTRHAPER